MSYKIERLQSRIKERVAMVIMRDLADPRIGLITITRVKLAKDLTHCTIYFSVLGGDADRSRSTHALDDGRGYIQREVARILRTRTTPHLEFEYDPSVEGSVRVSRLLRNALDPDAAADDADDEHADDDRE